MMHGKSNGLGYPLFLKDTFIYVHICRKCWRCAITDWWFQTFCIFHVIYGMSSQPHWRTHIFQRGRSTTNQITLLGDITFDDSETGAGHHGWIRCQGNERARRWFCWCSLLWISSAYIYTVYIYIYCIYVCNIYIYIYIYTVCIYIYVLYIYIYVLYIYICICVYSIYVYVCTIYYVFCLKLGIPKSSKIGHCRWEDQWFGVLGNPYFRNPHIVISMAHHAHAAGGTFWNYFTMCDIYI